MKRINIILGLFLLINGNPLTAQINKANVYWVGHSLMSHTYTYTPSENLLNLMDTMAVSKGKSYSYYQHTTPGAPLGWNWGGSIDGWASSKELIKPLTDKTHKDYGKYDVIVLTEGVNIYPTYQWWLSSFYARKFYLAAKNANPNTRLFLYESWHHYSASDEEYRSLYGPMSTFNFKAYQLKARKVWENIIDNAADPAKTQKAPDYKYLGTGTDPGLGNQKLTINIIPMGQVFIKVLDRLKANLSTDNWNYKGRKLKDVDFFQNPLANYPADTTTKVHPADALDDIHPSNITAYLNSLVHYAVIYKDNPKDLPAANGVPSNIAKIFKEITWEVVTNDVRTGVTKTIGITKMDEEGNNNIYPNPATSIININSQKSLSYKILNTFGTVVKKGASKSTINISMLEDGIYFIKTNNTYQKFIKLTH